MVQFGDQKIGVPSKIFNLFTPWVLSIQTYGVTVIKVFLELSYPEVL